MAQLDSSKAQGHQTLETFGLFLVLLLNCWVTSGKITSLSLAACKICRRDIHVPCKAP